MVIDNIKFTMSFEEVEKLSSILNKAIFEWEKITGEKLDKLSLMMDFEAVHSNGNPLDIDALKNFRTEDLIHDVAGILKNINRTNGKLENCFLPRCAKH